MVPVLSLKESSLVKIPYIGETLLLALAKLPANII